MSWLRTPWFRLLCLRSLAIAVALTLGLFVSADGADARLKNEWKFGGSLARLISLPFSSTILGNDFFDTDADDGGSGGAGFAGDMSGGHAVMLPQAAQPTGGSLGGLFSRPGVVGGFSAGFLGAGVLGLVFGHGLTSELTGAASFLGLIFQITLIVMLARLFLTWWRVDKSADDMSPRQLADAYGRLRNEAVPDINGDTETGTALRHQTQDEKNSA